MVAEQGVQRKENEREIGRESKRAKNKPSELDYRHSRQEENNFSDGKSSNSDRTCLPRKRKSFVCAIVTLELIEECG